MPRVQPKAASPASRGLLARPLDALVFLLPLIVFYEAVSAFRARDHVIAHELLQRFFELFGYVGMSTPGLAVVAILVATQVVSREPWVVHWQRVAWMYVEAILLAVPLFALNWLIPFVLPLSASEGAGKLLDRVALGVGAGIYEELVFRLILITLVMIVGTDLWKLRRNTVAAAAVLLSSVAFAAHHHRPIGMEEFRAGAFVFRALAGAYLAAVFWFRGYGPAAGCHAAYNAALALLSEFVVFTETG